MKSTDLIRGALQMSEHITLRFAESLRENPMARSTPGGKAGDGNHAIWVLGHLCAVEGGVPNILIGESNPVESWWPIFGIGSQPSSDAAKYPTIDELIAKYKELRATTLKLLDHIGEDGLDRPSKNIPPGFEKEMATCGKTLMVIAMHNMIHAGQLTDIRRVVGIKPAL